MSATPLTAITPNELLKALGCRFQIGQMILVEDGKTKQRVQTPIIRVSVNLDLMADGFVNRHGFFSIWYRHHYNGPSADDAHFDSRA